MDFLFSYDKLHHILHKPFDIGIIRSNNGDTYEELIRQT